MSACERSITLIVMDACREVYKMPQNIDECEKPLRDLPAANASGASIILFSVELGDKATEWAPNPLNNLHYCEGTFEFLRNLDKCSKLEKHTLGDFLRDYRYHTFSE